MSAGATATSGLRAEEATEPVLLADPRIRSIPVVEDGTPLVDLRDHGVLVAPAAPVVPFAAMVPGTGREPGVAGPVHPLVRETLATRLAAADASLPDGIRLLVVEALRPLRVQRAIHDGYRAGLALDLPWLTDAELDALASRFVSPPAIAPHVSGAAVDLTLLDDTGHPLDLGTAIDATPEESDGACYLGARNISGPVRAHRRLLSRALRDVGLVNYPTEWWHWSFGDRYWAHVQGQRFAVHGPVA